MHARVTPATHLLSTMKGSGKPRTSKAQSSKGKGGPLTGTGKGGGGPSTVTGEAEPQRIAVDMGGVLSMKYSSGIVRGAMEGVRALLEVFGPENVFIVSKVNTERGVDFCQRFLAREGFYSAGVLVKNLWNTFPQDGWNAKGRVCKELGIQYMIDDTAEHLEALSSFDVTPLGRPNMVLFPTNGREFPEEKRAPPGAIRARSWQDVIEWARVLPQAWAMATAASSAAASSGTVTGPDIPQAGTVTGPAQPRSMLKPMPVLERQHPGSVWSDPRPAAPPPRVPHPPSSPPPKGLRHLPAAPVSLAKLLCFVPVEGDWASWPKDQAWGDADSLMS